MKEVVNISIVDVCFLLLKKLKLIIASTLIFAIVTFLASSFLITPKYTASVNMYVSNGYTDAAIQEGTPLISTSAIAASQQLISTYSVLIKDAQFLIDVAADVGGDVTAGQVGKAISITAVGDSTIMRISAETADPQLSADICTSVTKLAPEMLDRVVRVGSVQKVSEVIVPTSPSSPNVTRNTIFGAVLGMVLCAVIVVLKEVLDTTIRDEEKIKDSFNIAFLGSIPSMVDSTQKSKKGDTTARSYVKMRINDKSPFAVTEAFKNLRTNLMFTVATSGNKAVEITSSNPSECKSVTVANLAITMAQTGARVLLIDADMRRPVQHKIFGIENVRGLSNVLAGLNELNSCVKQNVIPNLDVFTSGATPPNPSELLGSKNMEVLIEALGEYYDMILIDTPPIGVVSDALVLSKYTNGIVLMARHGSTRTGDLKRSIERIETVDANLLGIVLSDVDVKNTSYSYRNKYSNYSEYYSNDINAKTKK